jgi:hypothetical protein
MASKVNKIFSGCQPCQLVKNNRRLRDYFRPCHQDLILMVKNDTADSREDFIIR